MNLWNVTFTYPTGRRLTHHMYAVIAATADEAKAKAEAYVHPVPLGDAKYTIEAEVDPDGVISGGVYHTNRKAVS